jgi:hypothetical protein
MELAFYLRDRKPAVVPQHHGPLLSCFLQIPRSSERGYKQSRVLSKVALTITSSLSTTLSSGPTNKWSHPAAHSPTNQKPTHIHGNRRQRAHSARKLKRMQRNQGDSLTEMDKLEREFLTSWSTWEDFRCHCLRPGYLPKRETRCPKFAFRTAKVP